MKKYLNFIFGIVAAGSLKEKQETNEIEIIHDILDLEHRRPNQFSRVEWFDRPVLPPDQTLNKTFVDNLPRKRRESENEFEKANTGCKNNSKDISSNTHLYNFDGDNNPSIALAWTGDNGNTLIAVTTFESLVPRPSNIYRSVDGGINWTSISDKLDGEIIRRRSGFLTAIADSKRVIMVVGNHPLGYSESSELYLTKDEGATWKRQEVPFELNGANLKFHPTNSEVLMGLDMSGYLWVSTDFCSNWHKVHDTGRTHAYKWDPTDETGRTLYYTHDPTGTGRKQDFALTLYKSKDAGITQNALAEHVWSFGVEDKFLFVSVFYQKKGEEKRSRIMHVSTNRGEHFDAVQLPAVEEEQFYSILDATEDMIFMHIDEKGDTGKGIIYTSDEKGIVYTESLNNNLYPNGEDVTDFVKIESLRGVYVTSMLKGDSSIESVISFDKGASWIQFDEPLNCNPDNARCGCNTTDEYCHLQLHNSFSMAKGVEIPDTTYSSENSPGLILAHGNVGDGLTTEAPDLFVSSDGGYQWNLALKGPHRTAIGDSGSVVWAVQHKPTVDTIKYSFDEGLCWNEHKFTEEAITITGLIAEPGNKATDIAIWGWDETKDNWVVYVFDFKTVLGKECTKDDYIIWKSHEGLYKKNENKYTEDCQLGEQRSYQRLKKDSICYNGRNYKPDQNAKPCQCTLWDYKCDFGYKRKDESSPNCVEDRDEIQADHICIDGKEDEIKTKGYVKIPGDNCEEMSDDLKNEVSRIEKVLHKNCPDQEEYKETFGMKGSDSWTDYLDFSDLFDLNTGKLKADEAEKIADEAGVPTGGSKSLIAFLVLTVFGLIGTSGYFYQKSRKKAESVIQYNTMVNDDADPLDIGPASSFRDDARDSDDDAMLA